MVFRALLRKGKNEVLTNWLKIGHENRKIK
jgi:hypothetical protein